jgi:acyl-[acyl-carrier-protein]-phospholipid O-acyltransferase/long-chain-fatty-acid--[acyl-carrier-protein] ligase
MQASPVALFSDTDVPVGSTTVYLIIGVLVGVALLYLAWRRPEALARLIFWLPARLLYRIRVFGRENIPTTGPALFVCNHVSFIDAFLVFMAQKRPVRFMIWAPFTRVPLLRLLLRMARVIPIDSQGGPRGIITAMRTASDALKNGEIVCIFAEGAITRTGFLLPFHRGFEQILKRTPAPIIPVCLNHLWGSIFSYRGKKFLWKWPQRLPYPVTVYFGQPMPSTSSAIDVRLAIQKLSADCAIQRRDLRLPVHRQFIRMAARHPLRTCFIDPLNNDKVFRYVEVLVGSILLSRILRPILGQERMVGTWLPSSVGGALANIAIAMLGKVAVNLNYTSSAESIRSAIEQCGIRHVLTSRTFIGRMKLDVGPEVELVYLEDFRKEITKGQRIRALLTVLLLPIFALERWVLGTRKHSLDDLATIIFSSGSTGEPKGVMLSHANLAANCESSVQALDLRSSDRFLGVLPFFHSFGYTVTIWLPLQIGASAVYYPDPRQSKEIGELCRKHRATLTALTPTFLRFCLKRCEPDDFKSLRILITGAEKLPISLADEFEAKFGIRPLEGYGCTELSHVAAVNVPDWEEGGARQVGNRNGTIGQPIPGVAARIVDPDTLEPLPVGKEGLLLIYGGNVMEGYLGKPELTRQVIRDGWYVTGDIARYDEDGFLTITDRLSRFSKVGGEMVPHQKIEDRLHEIINTEEKIFAVTAVPDEKRGERLIVVYAHPNGLDVHHLWERLSDSGLPNLWVPAERDFVQVPEMPLLGSGKVDLKQVKQIALTRAGA